MKNIVLVAILLAALLPNALLAQSPLLGKGGFCFSQTIEPIAEFDNPLLITALIIAAIVSIVYMAGEMLEKPEAIAWAKNEAITLGWSVLLIIGVFGAFFLSCNITREAAGLPLDANPAQVAASYLDSLANSYGLPIATALVQDSIKDQFNSMPFAYWGFPWDPGGGGGVAFLANQRAWSAHREILASAYIPIMMSIKVQRMALDVLMLGVVGMLLPAALLLRMFFFSRDVGNFLIALAFSVYFFVPLTYVLSQQATNNVIDAIGGTAQNPLAKLSVGYDTVVDDVYLRIGFLSTQAILIPNLMLVILVTSVMAINKGLKGLVG